MTSIEFTTLETVRSNIKCLDSIDKSLYMIEKDLHALAKLKALELKSACPDSVAMIDQIMAETDDR